MSNPPQSNEKSLQNPGTSLASDIARLVYIIWSGKLVVFIAVGLASVLSIAYALSLPNVYAANALLAPAERSGGALSGLVRQYGGLASLAGVSMPVRGGGSRAQLGMQLMKSRAFTKEFFGRRGILPELMAVRSWNATTGEVILDQRRYDAKAKVWLQDADTDLSLEPTAAEAYREFSRILSVTRDSQTGYVSVKIEHQSPKIAAKWVNWLVEDVNAAVKQQDVVRAQKSVDYLEEQISQTSLADLQAMLYELIKSQTETVMLAEVRPEYVFKVIDPAVASELRSSPNRALICLVGAFLGGVFGILVVLLCHIFRAEISAFTFESDNFRSN